jgi:predicted aldo/keto reductase-like oxidoreductase
MRLPSRRFSLMGVDFEESKRIIRRGIDLGINYIDTAWFYHLGESEKALGEILKDGYREKVHLVTKLPTPLVRKTEDFERFLTMQMERLQTDYLDMYLFHTLNASYFEKIKRLGLFEKMEEAQRQGRIGHIGFSFHDNFLVFKDIIDYYDWDMAQIQYNYMDTAIQATTEGLTYAHSKGIAVVIMEPLKGGVLANPPAEALAVMESAAHQRTPVDWALQFLWNRPEVSLVLSGMGNMQMVEENCASADHSGVNTLSEDENTIITRLAEEYRKQILVPCTGCEYCMPCPSGVNIPKNFALLNNYSMEKKALKRWQIRRSYKKMVSTRAKLDKESPNGNATLCTECGICLPKCPQQIDIPTELKKVDAILGQRDTIQQHYPEQG